MEITELIAKYSELLNRKDELKAATKENNEAIQKMSEELSDKMVEEEIPSMAYKGYNYSLSSKTRYSKLGDEKLQAKGLDFYQVLRDQNLGYLIHEEVNANSLNSAMKTAAIQNDGELPKILSEIVSQFDYTEVSRRKISKRTKK